MNNLNGKKVLFLAPRFFGYENDIKNELVQLGAKVDYFNERPFESSVGKILIRLDIRVLINSSITSYYEKVIKLAQKEKYDYLFAISPETLTPAIVNALKKSNLEMKSIIYMWDSMSNKNNSFELLECFDSCYSFDPSCVNEFQRMIFLPLFYGENFDYKKSVQNETEYSSIFVGTIREDRYSFIQKLSNSLNNIEKPMFSFFYCPSKIMYFFKKYITFEFKKIQTKDLSFVSLDKIAIRDLMNKSEIIIDMEHAGQTGLTMRTIETLGLNKKLITTNKDILNYDFYLESNICIVDRKNPEVGELFLNSKFVQPAESIMNKYKLNNWIKTIFNLSIDN